MTRISSLAANTLLMEQIFRTQERVLDREIQVTSEKKSQDYQGIAVDSRRLVNLENERKLLNRYIQSNEQVDIRLQIQETAIDGIRDVVKGLKSELVSFGAGEMRDQERVQNVQSRAFEALKSMNFLLNTEVDGRYLFAGSRLDQLAVDLDITTLTAFQTIYDGARVSVPTTRDAQLEDFSFSANNTTDAKNWLAFSRVDGSSSLSSVTATSGEFANVTAGATITIAGTASNDGTYTVSAVRESGTIIDIVTEQLTDETTVAASLTYPDTVAPFAPQVINASVSFTQSTNTITASATGALSNIAVGTTFTVAGSSSNNGTYTVKSNDGTNLVIESKRFTDEATVGDAFSFTAASNLAFVDGGASADTIVAPAGTFVDGTGAALAAGTKLRIAGTGTANDGRTYTVASVSGDTSTVTLLSSNVVTAGTSLSGTVSNSAYFQFTAAANLSFIDGGTAADTVVAPAGTFVDAGGTALPAGTKITIAGTGDANAGQTYTIASVSTDTSTVTLASTDAVTAGTNLNGTVTILETVGTISSTAYYRGDQLTRTHRVDDDRQFTMDVNGANGAFEKAIRAMKLIAQGGFGTDGGLDQNTQRVSQAIYLLDSSLDSTVPGQAPFGTEVTNNIEDMQIDMGFQRVLISDTNKINKDFIGFLDGSIATMENTNVTETITKMLDDQRALEASFQVFARIRQLSLTNFI